MRNSRSSLVWRFATKPLISLAGTLGIVAAGACTENKSAEPSRLLAPQRASRGLTYEDSLQQGYFQPHSSASIAAAACDGDSCLAVVSADPPSLFQGFNQPGPVTLTFAGPVGSVTVTGSGAIQCSSGQYGTLVGYDSAGVELGRVNLELIDPADCSPASNPDDVTFGARATLVTSDVMARAVILPMSPLSFPVFEFTGHASATYSISLGPVAPPPVLKVTCPTSATRGQTIACEISVTPSTLAYTITQLGAQTFADGAITTIAFDPPGAQPAGQVYKLEGPAVSPTTLSVEATVVRNGQTVTLTKDVQFAVNPRGPELEDYIMTLRPEASGPGRTTRYPTIWTGGGALGLYARQSPDWSQTEVATATSGPNSGLSYVISIPGIPASLIYLTFAIFPDDPWYDAHPTTAGPMNSLGERICTKSQIDGLRLQVERHEGITMVSNSHFGIDQNLLRQWKFGRIFGGMVSAARGTPESIRQQMVLAIATEWKKEGEVLGPLQDAFDATDTPAIFAALGCSIFLD